MIDHHNSHIGGVEVVLSDLEGATPLQNHKEVISNQLTISLAFGVLEGAPPLQNDPRTVRDCRGACGDRVAPEASTGAKN